MPIEDASRILAALDAFADRNWRWGRGVVREIEVEEVHTTMVLHARLDTLTETRAERHFTRPGPADVEATTASPDSRQDLWELAVAVPEGFDDASTVVVLEGSEQVAVCDRCQGEQTVVCATCGGSGLRGKRGCKHCDAVGRTRCTACEGSGRLIDWRGLEVVWRHDVSQLAESDRGLGEATWLAAEGQAVCRLEATRVGDDEAIGALRDGSASAGFTQQVLEMLGRGRGAPERRVVRQRFSLHQVEVHDVQYQWRGCHGRCVVVGKSGIVHGNDLPLRRAYASRAWSQTLGMIESLADRRPGRQ